MEIQKGTEPVISVGVMSAPALSFTLNEPYQLNGMTLQGTHTVQLSGGMIEFNGGLFKQLTFVPTTQGSTFSLHNVVIGINFHWQRAETQVFSGSLSFVVDGDNIWAVNKLPIEDYLYCVIASEMSATSNIELLKAHAIVSRSWLVAQLQRKNNQSRIEQSSADEITRWYDRDDHHLFDVCADDHCQRYQGLTRIGGMLRIHKKQPDQTLLKWPLWSGGVQQSDVAENPVQQAIDQTAGMLIVSTEAGLSNAEVCDARFSKCCGGITETYETCWDNTPHCYLQSFADFTHRPSGYSIDLRSEPDARHWITTSPDAFCNTSDAAILKQVLNSYDQETADFYRWKVSYTTAELSDLVAKKTGIDFGTITNLIPLTRGFSGRISRLQIVGTKKTLIIGKELEIRRILSQSHLYSSAFVVEKTSEGFTLHGAGWGHGVGMCQIGAAVMSERGFGFKSIILHYFRCATIEKWW